MVGQPFPENFRWSGEDPGLTRLAWKLHREAALGQGWECLFSESRGKVQTGSKVDKNPELVPLCPPRGWRGWGVMVLSHRQGKGIPSAECQSLGEHQHPSQETGCNTLGLNLECQCQKRERKTCNPPISSPDSLSPARHINN